MSQFIVSKETIAEIKPHPNADRLEIAVIGSEGGWEVCVPKGRFKVGDQPLYLPVDSLIPDNLANEWGVAQYLGKNGRVKAARLRGVPSYGFVVEGEWPDGNLAKQLGIVKYEEPTDGHCIHQPPEFILYTDIQALRNCPNAFVEGEECIVTEKIHGRSARFGLVRDDNKDNAFEFMVGSHTKRKSIEEGNIYNGPYNDQNAHELLRELHDSRHSPIIFSEVFGLGMQDLQYGRKFVDYAIFDIAINGRYLDWDQTAELCSKYGLKTVPVLYRGPFNIDKIRELATGKTTVEGADGCHLREGVVVRPIHESVVQCEKYGIIRKIFKEVSIDYLTRKGKTTEHH